MLRRLSALSTLLFVLVVSAFAQLPNGMAMPDVEYNPLLLINASVQKELRLTPASASKIQTAFMDEALKIVPLFTGASKAAKPTEKAKQTKLMMDGIVHMQTRLAGMLTPTQKVRLRQLTLQSIGPSAALQPKVAKELGLTASQKSDLAASLAEANEKLAASHLKGKTAQDWQVQLKAMNKLQAEAKAKGERSLLLTFNSTQRAKWRAMLGKPFPLDGFMGVGNLVPPSP